MNDAFRASVEAFGYTGPMRCALLTVLLLSGCSSVCGTSEFLTTGTALDRFDADGDGYAEVQERCGEIWDSFGLRTATDTTFTFTPTLDASGKEDWDITILLLPSSQITVPNDDLVEGETVVATVGDGSHKIIGEADAVIQNSVLLEGELTFLRRRNGGNTVAETFGNSEDWRVSWRATFVDAQDASTELQRIEGTDWISVSDE